MGVTFTKTQMRVIEERGKNLLISAAAGSGKTATLVERIVRMVCEGEDPADIDRLLVLTFTNAAADQMRERIGRALNDRLSRSPENEHLQRQATLLYNAQITTIDSFCLFVLRNQFHAIGLDPGFRVAQEGEMRLLRADVLAAVLEQAYSQAKPAGSLLSRKRRQGEEVRGEREAESAPLPSGVSLQGDEEAEQASFGDDFLHCMEYFSPGSRDRAVEAEVFALYDFAMSMPFPEQWLAARKEDYRISGGTAGRAAEGSVDSGTGRGVAGNADIGVDRGSEGSGAEGECLGAALLSAPWGAFLLTHVRQLLSGLVEKLRAAVALAQEPDGPYHYGALLEQEIAMVEGLLRRCGSASDYDALCAAFAAISFARLPSKKDETISPSKREAAKGLRDSVKESLQKLRDNLFSGSAEQAARQMAGCKRAVSALVDLTLSFKEAFDRAKREKNLLDFDDIEHFALQALLRQEGEGFAPTETALEYRSLYREILVDEYQDSNLVQEYLLLAISGEAKGRYNRFMVGDVKQSIYRFRLARPDLFLEKYEAYGKGDGTSLRIDLHQNFRSRAEVLLSVNALFCRLMGKEVGGIVYDEEAALRLGAVYPAHEDTPLQRDADSTAHREAAQRQDADALAHGDAPWQQDAVYSENGGSVPAGQTEAEAEAEAETHSPNVTELLLLQAAEGGEELSTKEQEAYAVAERIKELLRDFQVTDKETGRLRRLACRDIVILLRTLSGWDQTFKEALEAEGIPAHVTSRTGYFAAGEVQELLHFLRVLDNPLQDIPLYGVLHAFLGGFTEEEVAFLRAAFPKKRYLYDALEACAAEGMTDMVNTESGIQKAHAAVEETALVNAKPDEPKVQAPAGEAVRQQGAALPLDKALRRKVCAFLEKIARYRQLATYLSVHELLQTILRESGYLHQAAARPEGAKRRANVEMLLVKAAEYEKTSYAGLYHFLRYMEQLEKYEVDYGEAALQDENADVVRIMSIHKSKGLEFPVVFVSGLGRRFRGRESEGMLLVDADFGLGADYVDPERRLRGKTLRGQAIAAKRKRDDLAEELRILYVAMTRAEEKLIMTGLVKNLQKAALSLLPLRRRARPLLPYDVLLGSDSLLTLMLSALSGSRHLNQLYAACGLEPDPGSPEYEEDMGFFVKLTEWDDVVTAQVKEAVFGEDARRRLLFFGERTEADEALLTELSHRFLWRYPHEALRTLYAKTTVSELKMAAMREKAEAAAELFAEKPQVPYLPKFIKHDTAVSGALRGSAVHKALELFDFRKVTSEVNADQEAALALLREELAVMERNGKLPKEYAAVLSLRKLAAFLVSPVARRMGDAARAGRLYKEQPFVMGLPASRLNPDFPAGETALIQGIIDVFFEEEDGFVVLDYKTDAVSTAAELAGRYQAQLLYYGEALEQIFGKGAGGLDKPVKERILYSFRLEQEIQVPAGVPERGGSGMICQTDEGLAELRQG